MNTRTIPAILATILLAIGASTSVAAQPAAPAGKSAEGFSVYRSSPDKARELLDRAAEYMKDNSSERAFAAFNNQRGSFYQNDLYVFVVGIRDGVMHAHGGAPEGMVGSKVLELTDAAGKLIIREMLDVVERQGGGAVDYVWLNRVTNKVEKKTSTVTRVGDYMLGVGFYTK